jgi:hypothetical protein
MVIKNRLLEVEVECNLLTSLITSQLMKQELLDYLQIMIQ